MILVEIPGSSYENWSWRHRDTLCIFNEPAMFTSEGNPQQSEPKTASTIMQELTNSCQNHASTPAWEK